MKPHNTLQNKVGLIIFIVGLVPLLILGGAGYFKAKAKSFEFIQKFYSVQLYHISVLVENLLIDTSYDVKYLSENALIKDRRDAEFTNFLNANEKTFTYHIGKTEQAIVDLLLGYKKTHPHVNSVYMGRENGSFIRANPRPRPTQYDPRIRPWYRAALENPKAVVKTKPYHSVTSNDINIGIAKALLDENQKVFGVVGVDITLVNLHEFMTHAKLKQGNPIILLDENGRFLTHDNPQMVYKHYSEAGLAMFSHIYSKPEGYIRWYANHVPRYLFFRTMPKEGWKICAFISAGDVKKSANEVIVLILITVLLLIVINGVNVIYFSKKIAGPFNTLVKGVKKMRVDSIRGKLAEKIEIQSHDEVEDLANTFNEMCSNLLRAYGELDESMKTIRELDGLKSAFVAMVSHELRTPLTSIKGYLALLNKEAATDKQKEFLHVVGNNTDRLCAIINDLLDVSKIETGAFTVHKEPGDILLTIQGVVCELMPMAEEKNVRIEVKPEESSMQVNFDKYRMIQTLVHVVRNAVQFSPRGSTVDISVERIKNTPADLRPALEYDTPCNHWILISVADHGQGVPRGSEMKIFDKFYQSDNVNTRRHQGIGIGMSIAKGLIDAHGGLIWAEADPGAKGMIIKIMLPVYDEAQGTELDHSISQIKNL